MKKTFTLRTTLIHGLGLLALAVLAFAPKQVKAQLSVAATNTAYTVTFDATLSGVSNGAWDGSGFDSSPSVGQLNSNAWASTGMSDGSLAFGGTRTSGDYSRGTSTGGVSGGGFYAFDVGTSDYSLGVQPTGSDYTPGDLTLRVQNTTGSALTSLDVAYELWVNNNEGRSSDFNFSWSTDDVTYTNVSALDYTSPGASDGLGFVQNNKSTTISSINVANNGYVYLRWSSDDVSGSGSRDEFSLDDISVTGYGAPSGPSLSTSALTGFGSQCINAGPYGPNSFTITGTSLTTADVTVGALSGFTYSTTSGGTYTSSLTLTQPGGSYSQDIFVKFDPTATASYDGNIAIGGGGATGINAAATGSGVDTAPAVTTGAASAITTSSATVAGTLDVTGACGTVTAYGIEYSTSMGFTPGTGTQEASTNLSGTAFSSGLTGLSPCTDYYTRAYATRASGTTYGAEGTFTSAAIAAPTATAGTAISGSGFTANWGAVSGATGYKLDVSTLATFGTTTPGSSTTETFTSIGGGAPGSYQTRSWTGVDGVGWTAYKSRTDQVVYSGNDAITLRDQSGAYLISDPIAGGVGAISFDVKQVFSGSGGIVTVTVLSGAGYATSTPIGTISYTTSASSFSQTFTDIPGPIKIQLTNNTGARSAIDNLMFTRAASSTPSFVPGYDDLSVAGTSQLVTGLAPLTTYYYRVRTVGASCTSVNSNVINVTTSAGASPLFSAGSLADFGDVCINTTTAASSFHVDGTNLTTADVTVAALSGFTYSTTELGTYTSTLSITQGGGTFSQDIWVKFSPTAVQSYDGNIVVGGGGAADINVAATGSGVDTDPTLTTGSASAITSSSATVAGQINDAGCGTITAYGIEYSTTMGFTPGTGTQEASSNLSGTDYSSALTSLSSCTDYYYRAYATRSSGTTYGAEGTFTSATIDAPVASAGTSIGHNGFTANWAAVSGATGYYLDVSTTPDFGTTVAATDLIISEYVEGSSNNKYIELYNGTGASVDLSDYTLNRYNNGSSSASSSDVLSGTLANNSTIVYANSSASIYGGSTTTTAICSFNGDDALSLTQTVGGAFVDIFGTIGEDPGSDWTSGSLSTKDQTLVRKATVTGGISSNPAAGFPALATEWDGYAQDDVSHLGSHSFNGFIPSYVSGYQNLSVGNVTSYAVTGLDPSTMYYYRVRAVNGSCTSDQSDTIAVGTLAIPVYYSRSTGFVSDDIWSDTPGGTAGPAVFTDSSSVVIQSGDVVTSAGNVDVNDLTVNSGGELVISANDNMSVSGDASFTGDLTANDNSTLSMMGSGGVTLSASDTLDLFNLTANVPNDLSTTATIRIRGSLALEDGDFDASSGNLTLASSATGTGRLDSVRSGASYTGDMTVERFIPAGHTNWRFMGSPVAGQTVNNWQDDFFTAGYPGSAYPNFYSPVGSGILWPSIRYYDETNTYADADTGVVGVSSNTQALTVGQGFLAWSGDNFSTTDSFVVDVTGVPTIASTPITLPMSYTSSGTNAADGWNLVSNPLPSAIAFDSISRGSDVPDQYWIFDPVSGTHKTYSAGVGQGGVDGKIQSSQAFWLKANGSNVTTTVSEADKVSDLTGGVFGGSQEAVRPILRLTVASTTDNFSDEATFVFDQGTPELDAVDAPKFTFHTVGAPLIAAMAPNGEKLAIDFHGPYQGGFSIPVTVAVDASGTYTINAGITGMQSLSCLSLEDLETGSITPLTDGASYSFTINADDDPDTPRFLLHATAPLAFSTEAATCANQPNGQATVMVTEGPVDITWTDASGNVLFTQNGVTDGPATYDQLGAGNYTVHLTPGGACNELTTDFSISAPAPVTPASGGFTTTSCPGTDDGVVFVQGQGGSAPYDYLWNNGSTEDHIGGAAGTYSVTVTDATGCTGEAGLTIPAGEGPTAGFTLTGTPVANEAVALTNTSTLGDAWAWDFGDGSTSTEMNPVHTWALPGTYTVTLTATHGDCSDTQAMEVTVDAETAIAAIEGGSGIRVWATPDNLMIRHGFGDRPVDVAVFDATGRMALQRNGLVKKDMITLSDRELGTGMWLVRITSGSEQYTFRVPLVR